MRCELRPRAMMVAAETSYLADRNAIAPVIPSITDMFMEAILQKAAAKGVRSASWILIRLPHEVAPLFRELPGHSPEILLLALCAGGTALSHVNDAGFWLVNQCLGLSVPDTLRTWTVMKVITSAVGILCVLLAHRLLG